MQALIRSYTKYLFLFLFPFFSSLAIAQEFHKNWQLTMPENLQGVPAYFNKTIYITDKNTLYSISSDGNINWELEGVTGRVSVNSTGVLYVNYDGHLSAVSESGSIMWQSEMNHSKLLIGRNDEIYTSDDDYIYGISATGELLWRREVKSVEPLAVDSDGTLYLASIINTGDPYQPSLHIALLAFTNEGFEVWRQLYPTAENTYKAEYSLALSESTIYFLYNTRQLSYDTGIDYSTLAAVDKLGNTLWRDSIENKWGDLGGPTYGGSPQVVIDDNLNIVGKGLFGIFKYSPEGELIWGAEVVDHLNSYYLNEFGTLYDDGFLFTSPVVTDSNDIFISGLNGINWIGSSGEHIASYDSFNGVQGNHLKSYTFLTLTSSGDLYFGHENILESITTGMSLSENPWPTISQNNQRLSRSSITQALIDTDGDGIADINDSDNDNDGVRDESDDAPLDKDIQKDNDDDGIDDSIDLDDDNDGVEDSDDLAPLLDTIGTENGNGTFRWFLDRNAGDILYTNDHSFISVGTNKHKVTSIDINTRETNWELEFEQVKTVKANLENVFVCHWNWHAQEYQFSVYDSGGVFQWLIAVDDADECQDFAVSEVGDIYFTNGHSVRSISKSGSQRWEVEFQEENFITPLISTDSYIYLLSRTGAIKALTSDGHEIWGTSIDEPYISAGIIDNDGNLVVVGENEIFNLDSATGKTRWTHKVFVGNTFLNLKNGLVQGVVIDRNSNIHLSLCSKNGSDACFLYSVDEQGNWIKSNTIRSTSQSMPQVILSAPTVDNKGNVYLYKSHYRSDYDIVNRYTEDRSLIVFSEEGETSWEYERSKAITSTVSYSSHSPVLTTEGYIIAPSKNDKVTAVNAGGNKLSQSSWPSASGDFGNLSKANSYGSKTLLRNKATGKWRMLRLVGRQEVAVEEWDFSSNLDWTYQAYDDINGDGQKDVIIRHNKSGQWFAYLLSNSKIIDKGYIRITSTWNWQLAGTGDFNNDGNADLLLRHRDGHWILYFMNGRIVESYKRPEMSAANVWVFEGIGDFQPDGHADVLIKQENTHSRYIYNMESGEFKDRGHVYLEQLNTYGWDIIDIVDLWREQINEKRDIIKRNPKDGRWAIEHIEGRVVQYTKYPSMTTGATWRLVNVDDFDEDGHADVLMQNEISGKFYLYFLERGEIKSKGYVQAEYSPEWQVPTKYLNPNIYPNIN